MKKRTWFKRSSLILSAVVSMAAPPGKTGLPLESKGSKPCKKSKAPLSSLAEDGEADSRPPFGDHPPTERLRAAKRVSRSSEGPLEPAIAKGMLADECCAEPESTEEAQGKKRRPRPAFEKHSPTRYAWKKDISTTVFWIGEQPTEENPTPNRASSWDAKWAQHYGGFDDPDPEARKGFLPAAFTPKQNPFYVALPYNDLAEEGHKTEAESIIPWFNKEFTSKWKSVCKGRWIAIRKGNRVCYAQWEDAGPFTTNDASYVFGETRPKANANHDAGLDVSPAVRDYLGLDGNDATDWKFVEFEDVPLGPWAEHGNNNDFVMNRRATDKESVAASHIRTINGKRGS